MPQQVNQSTAFWRSTLPHLQSVAFHSSSISMIWRRKQHTPPQMWLLPTSRHNIPSLKTWILNFNLVLYILYHFQSLWIPTLKFCLLLLISMILPSIKKKIYKNANVCRHTALQPIRNVHLTPRQKPKMTDIKVKIRIFLYAKST
jgi:hypothetical protein